MPDPIKCPKCAATFKGKYAPQERGRHMRFTHKIKGRAAAGVGRGTLPCSECGFKAFNKAGLGIHLSSAHGIKGEFHSKHLAQKQRKELNAPTSAIVHVEGDNHADQQEHQNGGIAAATLQVALGRFQEFCRNFATEYDLPPRMFAARFSELIYAAQIRQSLGHPHRLPAL